MMKKSKRVFSFLMAMLMLFSTFSFLASAEAPYKDFYIPASQYDDLDKPFFTPNQCSSMLLDYVDKILAEKNIVLDFGVLGSLNLTSVDNILNDLSGAGTLNPLVFGTVSDIQDLDKSAIQTYRRNSTPAATADTNVIYSIIQYVNDNKDEFAKFIDGSFVWGFAASNETLNETKNFNVNQTLKEQLFKMAYPGAVVPKPVNETADNMIQQIIVNFITGSNFPQLAGSIDLNSETGTAYDFLENFLQDVYNLVLVPMINTELKKAVREICGVVYDDTAAYPNGDESNLNEYAATFDIDYVVPVHTFAAGTTLVSDLNSIFAEIVNTILKDYSGWVAGGNSHVLENLASVAKAVLKQTDSKVFAEYVSRATYAEIDAMNNQQLFSYLLRSILNSTVGTMNIPAAADTLVEVVWYALKEVLAEKVPKINYSTNPQTLEGILYMLADLAVYFINQTVDMNPAFGTTPGTGLLLYGQGFDSTLTSVMAWVKTNFGGLLNLTLTGTDGWADLNTLVTAVIPANRISGFTDVKTLVKTQVLQSVLDLDATTLFALFDHVAGNDLSSKTIKKVLLESIARVVNIIFPGAVLTTHTTFDQIIDNTQLKGMAERLVTQLNQRRSFIIPAVLPLLNSAIGVSAPEGYKNLTITLPKQISAATVFTIRNNSTGVNTGATNKAGVFTQDSLYKIKIVSITPTFNASANAITVNNLVGTIINGGESVNCSLSCTNWPSGNVLMVNVTYDVYTELGTKLTSTPLTAMAFSYISTVIDDGANYTTLDPNTLNTHTLKYKNVYGNQDYNLANLVAQDQFILQRATTNDSVNSLAATVSRTIPSVNATLIANGVTAAPWAGNITTTYDGGFWSIPAFTVDPAAIRPDDGAYKSNFSYSATKTDLLSTPETFAISNYVVFYNDFGLPALLSAELNAKRDPANYSDPDAWNDYIFALKNAIGVTYRPKTASTFMTTIAPAYEDAVQMLNDAISALEATENTPPLYALQAALDSIEPSNVGRSYDDPAYSYFGMADYVPYTYLNYQREVENCRALFASQQPPTEPVLPENPTPEQLAAYEIAHAQWVIDLAVYNAAKVHLDPVDVAYALHRLNLYASRLIRVQATKDRLSEDLAAIQADNPVQGKYTTNSWAAYQKALAFAVSVNAQSAAAVDGTGEYILRQTKVDTAREKLIEAYKQLILLTGCILPADGSGTVVDLLNGFIYGLAPGSGALGKVKAALGYSLIFHVGPNGPGTGSTVEAVPNTGKAASVFFTVVIYGDVNGDANIDSLDAGIAVDVHNGMIVWEADSPYKFAGDVNGDGNVDSIDAGIMVDYENSKLNIDQNTGLAVPS